MLGYGFSLMGLALADTGPPAESTPEWVQDLSAPSTALPGTALDFENDRYWVGGAEIAAAAVTDHPEWIDSGLEIPAGDTAQLIGDALAAFLVPGATIKIDFEITGGDGAFVGATAENPLDGLILWALSIDSGNSPMVQLASEDQNEGEGWTLQLGEETFSGRRMIAFTYGADKLHAAYNGGPLTDAPGDAITTPIAAAVVCLGNEPSVATDYEVTFYSMVAYAPQPSLDLFEMAGGVGDPFVITTSATANVEENETLAVPLTASITPDSWDVPSGADAADFDVDGATLTWVGDGTKDYEEPDDTGTNNTYVANVEATFEGAAVEKAVTVTVTDADETPTSLGALLLNRWNADDAGSLTLDVAAVTSWADSVAAVTLAQASAPAKPTYSATSFKGTAPGVAFDGTAQFLELASTVGMPTGTTEFEVWRLLDQQQVPAVTANATSLAWGGSADSTRVLLRRAVVSGVNRAQSLVSGVTVTNDDTDYSGIHVVRTRVTATGIYTSVDNGPEDFSAITLSVGTVRTRMGANASITPGGFGKFIMSEAIITAPLTDFPDHEANMWTYFMDKGGI